VSRIPFLFVLSSNSDVDRYIIIKLQDYYFDVLNLNRRIEDFAECERIFFRVCKMYDVASEIFRWKVLISTFMYNLRET
jgi:hypothetical protein